MGVNYEDNYRQVWHCRKCGHTVTVVKKEPEPDIPWDLDVN